MASAAATSLTASIFGGGGEKSQASGGNAGGGGGGNLSGLFDATKSFPVRRPPRARSEIARKKIAETARETTDRAAKSAASVSAGRTEKAGPEATEAAEGAAEDAAEGAAADATAAATTTAPGAVKKNNRRKKKKRGTNGGTAAAATKAAGDADAGDVDGTAAPVEARTVFVGNLPPDATRKSLAALFRPCGAVASARIRSVAVTGVKLPPDKKGNQNLMRKVCANTNRLDDEAARKTSQGYVVFASSASVPKALALDNSAPPAAGLPKDVRLRVDTAEPTHDHARSVFVGNLPYRADESTLRAHFVSASGGRLDDGDVAGARIVRDPETQQCKGFGYVLLKERSGVPAALECHETVYMKRTIRVSVCGKRTKGKRGVVAGEKEEVAPGGARRVFEGRRATTEETATGGGNGGVGGDDAGAKRKGAPASSSSAGDGGGGQKRRKRGESAPSSSFGGAKRGGAGPSKRAAAEAKVGKRMKKVQKRVDKGMGKAKKMGR